MDMVSTEQELAAAVQDAQQPLRVVGGGTCGIECAGVPLSAAGMSGVELYEPGSLTLVARAGTPVADIQELLAQQGQSLAFEPPDLRRMLATDGVPTIGGVVSCNASGPRRVQAGACRDSVLGVRFVDGRGEVLKNGGRVMKNVTGYDLVKLLTGSFGTLGVLSEVSLKVLPTPEAEATVELRGLANDQAIAALSAALGSPYDVTGAAHIPAADRTVIRLEGFAASVQERAEKLSGLLAGVGDVDVILDAAQSGEIWKSIRDVEPLADQPGDVWRISVKPTDGPRIAALVDALDVLFDWGGGLVWARVAEGTDIRPMIAGVAGHATLVRAAPQTFDAIKRFQPEPAAVARLSAGLRAQFDPRGILNPGVMG